MKTTRKHLIEATKELLWERGYEAMSPRAVLERSGAGQGSLYHHFSGKAELVSTALDEIGEDMHANNRVYLHSDKPALQRIRDFLTMPRDALRGCRLGKMTQEPMIAQDGLREPIAAYFTELKQDLIGVLEEARQEGTLREDLNLPELAATIIAIVQGGYVLARASQDPEQMQQAIRGILALIDSAERK